ncbi:MlaD family protein [Aureivirga sp. CE67]|uniref:MlaD family protein n=1 Tax=Aureivirga sp. CE67 TaxID=1788983 RepID=UPI0018CAB908|nr:MlaD family protein [Aureivirga sp. CE67]
MKLTRELKTGITFLVVIALFIWGYNYLKGHNLFDGSLRTFYAKYDNVHGLNTASVVRMNGLQVGKVSKIYFDPDTAEKGQIIVAFSLENDITFSKESEAVIASAGLAGGQIIKIMPKFDGTTAESGDYLPGIVEPDILTTVAEKLEPLQEKLSVVLTSTDSLMVGLNDVLNTQSRVLLKEAIKDLNGTVYNFKKISHNLEGFTKKGGDIDKTLNNITEITANFEKISDTISNANLGNTLNKLNSAMTNLDDLMVGVQNGEGTLGKLMKNDTLYVNLKNASRQLEQLIQDIKLHPKRYVNISVFGRKEKPYSPPANPNE